VDTEAGTQVWLCLGEARTKMAGGCYLRKVVLEEAEAMDKLMNT
jgi:hypothetical protein